MSIDTSILLRVRDRPLFRRLLEAHAGGIPVLWPLEDDSVLVGTTIRWDSPGMELEVRELLASLMAGRLGDLHDDPRGVYLCTDMALPRRKTYEGAFAELGGRFIDPTPPTPEELAARAATADAAGDRTIILFDAMLAGDVDAFVRGLAGASESQRAFMSQQWGFRHPDKPLPALPPAPPDPPPPPPPPAAPVSFVAPESFGAVCVLLPAPLAELVARGAVPKFEEGSRRVALDDGQALYFTDYGGDASVVAAWLSAACLREGVERAPCMFLKEAVARELEASGVKTRSDVLAAIGDRHTTLSLLSWEEQAEAQKALARAWLEAKG